jgi:hypothetical protein
MTPAKTFSNLDAARLVGATNDSGWGIVLYCGKAFETEQRVAKLAPETRTAGGRVGSIPWYLGVGVESEGYPVLAH